MGTLLHYPIFLLPPDEFIASNNFYDLHCYGSDYIYNNQFLANSEMSQNIPFLMNISTCISILTDTLNWQVLCVKGKYLLNSCMKNWKIWFLQNKCEQYKICLFQGQTNKLKVRYIAVSFKNLKTSQWKKWVYMSV